MRTHPVYRSLLWLYPATFRREYGEDLVAAYDELAADRGAITARTRIALDLAITVPRYHLENVMTEQHGAAALTGIIVLLAAAGLAPLFFIGVHPAVGLLVVVAVALGIARRSTLARSLRVPDSNVRRRRLRTAAVLALGFVASYLAFAVLVGESWTVRDTILSIAGTSSLIGALVFLVAGLLTRRTPAATPTIAPGTCAR